MMHYSLRDSKQVMTSSGKAGFYVSHPKQLPKNNELMYMTILKNFEIGKSHSSVFLELADYP